MARVKLSGLLNDISGSVGGVTFQRHRSGLSLRSKPLPKNSNSPARIYIKQMMTYLQNEWRNLPYSAKQQYDMMPTYIATFTEASSSVTLTGHQLFIKYNSQRYLAGYSPLTSFYISPELNYPEPQGFMFFSWEPNLYVDINEEINPDIFYFSLYISNHYVNISQMNTRRMHNVPFNIANLYQIECYDGFLAKFGVLPPDQSFVDIQLKGFSMQMPILITSFPSPVTYFYI